MNCTKKLTLAGCLVKYADQREPEPRTIHEEVFILDKEILSALDLLGLNVVDFITTRYERGGYHVTSEERISTKRTVSLDLGKLWDAANSQALTNSEGRAE